MEKNKEKMSDKAKLVAVIVFAVVAIIAVIILMPKGITDKMDSASEEPSMTKEELWEFSLNEPVVCYIIDDAVLSSIETALVEFPDLDIASRKFYTEDGNLFFTKFSYESYEIVILYNDLKDELLWDKRDIKDTGLPSSVTSEE